MSVTSVASGSQACTISTTHTLSTQTTAGVYILVVDLTNLAAGDTVVLALNTKAKSGSSSVAAYSVSYANAQSTPNVYSIPVPITDQIIATMTQTAGTGRTFDWNLLTL
jgi:hypothetical protein